MPVCCVSWSVWSNFFHTTHLKLELYELYFISVKVLKVQVKNKVHKVRTSQLWGLHITQLKLYRP